MEKLQQKVDRYSKAIRVTPSSVVIKTFKGELDFNWKIIIAPNRIVDYVVVHELCHLRHHNHSPEFWKRVNRVFPEYRDCKERLKMNSQSLII